MAMTLPLVVLALFAVIAGFLGIPEVFAKDAHWLQQFLAPVFADSTARQQAHAISHSTEYALMGGTVLAILVIMFYALKKFGNYTKTGEATTGFSKVLENKWYVDELYDAIINKPLRGMSNFLGSVIERSLIDGIVNGIGKFIQYSSRQMRWLQSGQVGSYILIMVVATVVFFIIQIFGK
jgi:NADH-quinone oxidoreductase subunit L